MHELKKEGVAVETQPVSERPAPKYDYQRPRIGSESQPYEDPQVLDDRRRREVDPALRNLLSA